MRINAISNATVFGSVYLKPYIQTTQTLIENTDKSGIEKLNLMCHYFEYSKKWDMKIFGTNGKLNFNSESKGAHDKKVYNLLGIEPINAESIEQDGEFIAKVMDNSNNNYENPFVNLKFKFKTPEDAITAYSTLYGNYQIYDRIRMSDNCRSNFARLCIAEENFKIMETAEISKINPKIKSI